MRLGLALGLLTPGSISTSGIVLAHAGSGIGEGVATILSVFFSLNLLLGCFNLLPFPPLDGYGVLGLFTSESGALRLQEFRLKIRGYSIIGLLLGWKLLETIYMPILVYGIRFIYLGFRFS
jgi:Zn-dependent protease